jgi:UDP-N-acetylglucosamine acyltransferase
MARVHPSSVVDRGAEISADVEIGPFCHVHAGARIGAGTRLISHVVVMGNTTLGAENVLHPFAVLGGVAQVRKAGARGSRPPQGRSALEIADHNVFRENVTVNASTGDPRGTTRIGSHNLFMAGCHVAHDVIVGSRCVVANCVQLAGHVVVDDWVTFGGLAGVAQHLRVGQGAFVAAGAMCERDVPPFVIVQGDRARVRALNVVGLERRGVPPESLVALRKAFSKLWRGASTAGSFDEALRGLHQVGQPGDPWVAILVDWLLDPIRAVKPARRQRPP